MHIKTRILSFTFLIGLSMVGRVSAQALFVSSVLTPPHSFTIGCEGPAVDKAGNLYAVNYAHDGSVGKITPDGKTSVFIDLPKGSIGNGIRFDSKGNMLVADYTMHNIWKVDMATKKFSVFAHEGRMSQPNDIAIDNKDRLYASDPNWKNGTGRIWRIDTDGKFTLLDSMKTVNGIDVSPDNKTLYVGLFWTGALSVIIGLIISSAFSAILVYATELVPGKVGMIAGLFFGFAFGMGGLGSAVLGWLADHTSIGYVFKVCAFLPLIGIITGFLPNLESRKK